MNKIGDICDQNHNDADEMTFRIELLLVSSSSSRRDARPLVVIAHEHLDHAKHAARVLKSHPVAQQWGFEFFPEKDDWAFNMRRGQPQSDRHSDSNDRSQRHAHSPDRGNRTPSPQARSAQFDLGLPRYTNPLFPREATVSENHQTPFNDRSSYHLATRTRDFETRDRHIRPAKATSSEPLQLGCVSGVLGSVTSVQGRVAGQATMGGTLILNSREYFLTAAHPFLEGSAIRKQVELRFLDNISEPSDRARVEIDHESKFFSLVLDWILLRVPRILGGSYSNGPHVYSTFSGSLPPAETVILQCGKSGRRRGQLLGTSFSIGLKWLRRFGQGLARRGIYRYVGIF